MALIFSMMLLAALPAVINVLRARSITHVVFFSAGYLYYWILPILVGEFPFSGGISDPGYNSWAGLFTSLSRGQLTIYAVSILVYYLCFRAGDKLAKMSFPRPSFSWQPRMDFVAVLYVGVFIIAAAYSYHLRWAIGMNYGDTDEVLIAKGTLTAVSLVLFGLALLLTTSNEKETFAATIRNRWFAGYALIALVLLGMGQRLYFMTSILLLVAYRSVFFRKYSKRGLITFAVAVAVLSGFVGIVRLGSAFSAEGLVLNLAFEPIFTSFSLVSFLGANHLPWLAVPKFLAGDLLNLIPTAVLPTKHELLLDPLKSGYWFVSPLGAFSSWVSFIINFGLIGTMPVMFLIGYFLRWLLVHSKSPVFRTQYLMCSAFVVFTFFRDPFAVSLVKNIFEFSIMMPLLCACISGWMVWTVQGGAPDRNRGPLDEARGGAQS